MSVPETILPAATANNESQFGASYLNNHAHQGSPNNNVSNNSVSVSSFDSFTQENLANSSK